MVCSGSGLDGQPKNRKIPKLLVVFNVAHYSLPTATYPTTFYRYGPGHYITLYHTISQMMPTRPQRGFLPQRNN